MPLLGPTMLRQSVTSRSPLLHVFPSKLRLRHVILAAVAVILFLNLFSDFSFSSTFPAAIGNNKAFHIQARFKPESEDAKSARLQRRDRVKAEFIHAWEGYKKHAWMYDEVKPISGGQQNTFVGWAATLVDSLDSLYIMGLKEEFEGALKALKEIDFSKPKDGERIPVFETNIRYLGGLLGAWDISGHQYPILREKATQLGDFLLQAFKTPNGLPVPYYWWQRKSSDLFGESGVLAAQIGSLSMEFIRLTQVTGDSKYADAIQKITDQLANTQNETSLPGMWPIKIDTTGPKMKYSSADFTLGALADSMFEYLPKTALLLPPALAKQYTDMYTFAFSTITKNILFRPTLPGNPDILFPGTYHANPNRPRLDHEVQHLACFVGGMVALASRMSKSPAELDMGRRLTDGCVWAYAHTPTGIMAEISHFDACPEIDTPCEWAGGEDNKGFRVDDPSYQLRPEAIESVFVMYRLTGDASWQDKGWTMFEAISKHTRTDIANARLQNVMAENPKQVDSMESFWLAETLKYFYLLFSEPDLVSLDEFVLNTEAHPLRWATK
ncbi:putative mannosyl-oligosaccharide 1,2-alpha-mannosidase IB [Xylogone sp. PMI_703]|nr:putative mannosyl-oligosaccharide 1,2-alpha-mannosidase IB [Xylogone sp. PMI_703]